MKKALAILLAFSLLLSLTACGGSTAPASSSAESEQSTDAVEDAAIAESTAEDQNLNADAAEPAADDQDLNANTADPAADDQDLNANTADPAAKAATSADSEQTSQNAASSETAAQATTDQDPSLEAQSPVGIYKLTGQSGNMQKNLSDIISIVRLGGNLYLSLKEDGTGSMNLLEAGIPLEWDNSDIIIQPKEGAAFTEPVRISYACEGESLKMSTSDYSLDFSRLNEQELAEYKENGAGSLKGQLSMVLQMLGANAEDSLEDLLFLAMMMSGSSDDNSPIPEDEPSEGPVTGSVDGIEFTILGADQVQSDEGPLIVFYIEAVNTADDYQEIWYYDFEASQNGEFLEDTWGLGNIPEESNVDLGMAPGRTLRFANVFKYGPDGGVVGFRISYYEDKDNTVLYYADPRNLSGAPAEPFAYDADPSIPEYVQALPEEIEEVGMESVEFFTDEDGDEAVRFYFTFRNTSDKDEAAFCTDYGCYALQDGLKLPMSITIDSHEEENNYAKDIKPGEEILCASSYKLRTGSPVSFIVYEAKGFDESINVAAKSYEVE